jgi:hypothetical protein
MNPLGLCPNKGQSPRVPGRRTLPPDADTGVVRLD